ncbi:hypothetical protein [Cryptosporangium sp. NPDC051539]|uniref:hypothetical protein n=1 Tax=Cryptosporangium sp. NPDC051539 TaxID=3363962 RepID=UPI0037A4158D
MSSHLVPAPGPLDAQALLLRAIAGMKRDRDERWAPVAGWLGTVLTALRANPGAVEGGVLAGGLFDHAFIVARSYLRMNADGALIAADPAPAPAPARRRRDRDDPGGTAPLLHIV